VRDPLQRLQDILDAIENIERYARRGREAFENDELIQHWCVRHLQIIGEAVRALPSEVRQSAPDIPWSKITGMRHILVHDSFAIDVDVVWDAVQGDLPKLKEQIEALLKRLENRG
jgi:uncharacterized protein with HEPN domain